MSTKIRITENMKFILIYPPFAEFDMLSIMSIIFIYFGHIQVCLKRDKQQNSYKQVSNQTEWLLKSENKQFISAFETLIWKEWYRKEKKSSVIFQKRYLKCRINMYMLNPAIFVPSSVTAFWFIFVFSMDLI